MSKAAQLDHLSDAIGDRILRLNQDPKGSLARTVRLRRGDEWVSVTLRVESGNLQVDVDGHNGPAETLSTSEPDFLARLTELLRRHDVAF